MNAQHKSEGHSRDFFRGGAPANRRPRGRKREYIALKTKLAQELGEKLWAPSVLDVDADATEPPTWARKDNVEFWREAVRLRGLLLDAIDAHEPDTAA